MESPTDRMQRRFRVPIIIATLLVIPVLILQGFEVPEPWETVGYVLDWILWLTFAAEVVAMLAVSDDRRGWARAHVLDILIVVLTPPVGQTALHSLRVLRLLQLVRLARVATLLRGVFTIEGVRFVAFLAFVTLIVGAQAFITAESQHDSIWSGLYWALGAMTTAGSGSVVATTATAAAVGSILTIVGISFAAVITGAIAERFVASESTLVQDTAEDLRQDLLMHDKLDVLLQRLDRLEAAVAEGRSAQDP